MPQPPSPTTTNFLEYEGGWVMFVASETRSVELAAVVLIVPSLFLVLCCLTGLRLGETEPDWELTTPLLLEPRRKKS